MTRVERAGLVPALALLGMIGVLGLGTPAHAQSAEAEVLFRDGRALIAHGKLAAGCDKLGASERLESSVGTLLNLGDCREKLGKLASAWAAFRKAEAMAKRAGSDDKRQAEAGRRAARLEPRLSNLVIEVPRRVDGLVVRRDAELVDEAQWSTAVPVDPGSYTIVAEAPGFQAWRTTVVIGAGHRGDGERQVVSVPELEREPVAAAPAPAAPSPGSEPAAPVILVRSQGTWSGVRKLSVVGAVAGAGLVGAGVYFGMHAKDLQDRADQRCPLTVCTDPQGLDLNTQAQTAAHRANILYVAGGATLATAIVLWLVGAPSETTVVPTAGDHRVGLAMKGSF